ncbi:MAG: hypothetical protein NT028_10585, partial [candidate division Zixibacteria bacterium]|nr:hypothetical protein [candidate division Zixibacteria bacterium]
GICLTDWRLRNNLSDREVDHDLLRRDGSKTVHYDTVIDTNYQKQVSVYKAALETEPLCAMAHSVSRP